MRYDLKPYAIWEYGQRKDSHGRPHQEDCIYPAIDKLSDSDRLFILCDGMGGHDAGEVASAAVCEAMSDYILESGCDKEGVFTTNDFEKALDEAFNALDRKDNGAEKKMGTTLAFMKFHERGVLVAHMGDSRVYHIRPGKDGESTRILYESQDHSLVNDLIRSGELTREEARHSRQKNVITRAMQPNMPRRPKADVKNISDIRSGDYFYMCSDGMLEDDDMENGTFIRNIFSEMGGDDKNKVGILKSVTDNNSDNHSAIIVHVLDVEISDRCKADSVDSPKEVENRTNPSADVHEKGFVIDPQPRTTITRHAGNQGISDEDGLGEHGSGRTSDSNRKKPADKPKKQGKFKFLVRFVAIAATILLCEIVFSNIRSCINQHETEEPVEPVKKENVIPAPERRAPAKPNRHKPPQENQQQNDDKPNPSEDSDGHDESEEASDYQAEPDEASEPEGNVPSDVMRIVPAEEEEDIAKSDEQLLRDSLRNKK